MKIDDIVVIIPIYKEDLTEDELISYIRTLKILKDYAIFLIHPDKLELKNYLKTEKRVYTKSFDKNYFQNIKNYSSLMLSDNFYSSFSDYEYMLICQLDCYIFKDELLNWCNRGFDYVGAPWVLDYADFLYELALKKHKFPLKFRNKIFRRVFKLTNNVGNGGLSLRKVNTHIEALKKYQYVAKNWYPNLEDTFWSLYVSSYEKSFKIPNYKTASAFSIETYPQYFIQFVDDIPFGCHAWKRWGAEFWNSYYFKGEYGSCSI